jgi:hypothetical protein
MMENMMSYEANALLQQLLVSGIDAAGEHCRHTPAPQDPEPEDPDPAPPSED